MSAAVSVIIPAYNSEKNIRKCVDSVIAQTLTDIEIILVDDGSTDSTGKIFDEYKNADPRIQVIHQKNAGAGAARNHGMEYATGEYLSILDADDFFEPNMLELSYQKARRTQADLVVFASDLYDDSTEAFRPNDYSIRWHLLPNKQPFCALDVKEDVFRVFVGWAWDKLFRTEFVREKNLQFQVQRTTNDMLFVFSAILGAKRIVAMEDVLAHYRRGEGSLSVTREKSWHCFYDALTALKQQMIQWELYDRFERDFINYSLNFSLWHLNTLCEPTHSMLEAKLREEWFDELGITSHPREYFYNKKEHNQYLAITGQPVPEDIERDQSLPARMIQYVKSYGLKRTCKKLVQKIRKVFQ